MIPALRDTMEIHRKTCVLVLKELIGGSDKEAAVIRCGKWHNGDVPRICGNSWQRLLT